MDSWARDQKFSLTILLRVVPLEREGRVLGPQSSICAILGTGLGGIRQKRWKVTHPSSTGSGGWGGGSSARFANRWFFFFFFFLRSFTCFAESPKISNELSGVPRAIFLRGIDAANPSSGERTPLLSTQMGDSCDRGQQVIQTLNAFRKF